MMDSGTNFHNEIQLYLDNDHFITSKWLAVNLSISFLDAKKHLNDFKVLHPTIASSYLVSGYARIPGTETSLKKVIIVVPDSDLDESLKQLLSPKSELFSIQNSNSNSWSTQIVASDYNQARDELYSKETKDFYLKNHYCSLQLQNLVVKGPGNRIIPTLINIPSTNNAKETVEEHMARLMASSSTASKSSVASTNVIKFFANTKPKTKDPTVDVVDVTKVSENSDKEKIRSSSKIIDDEEEWDDGTGIKLDRTRLKKRVQGPGAFIDDDETVETTDTTIVENICNDEDNNDSQERHTKKKKPAVFGAMDSFVSESLQDQVLPPTDGKRRKKKLVEKVCNII